MAVAFGPEESGPAMKRDSEEPDLRFCCASASPAIVFTERNVA